MHDDAKLFSFYLKFFNLCDIKEKLIPRWCALYDCGAFWLLNFKDGAEGSRK